MLFDISVEILVGFMVGIFGNIVSGKIIFFCLLVWFYNFLFDIVLVKVEGSEFVDIIWVVLI